MLWPQEWPCGGGLLSVLALLVVVECPDDDLNPSMFPLPILIGAGSNIPRVLIHMIV